MNKKLLTKAILSIGVALILSAFGIFIVFGEFRIAEFFIAFVIITAALVLVCVLFWLIGKTGGFLYTVLSNLLYAIMIAVVLSLFIYSLVFSSFDITDMNWSAIFKSFVVDGKFYIIFIVMFILSVIVCAVFIDRAGFFGSAKGFLKGKGRTGQVEANLENSRWLTDAERDKIFSSCKYTQLAERKKDGVPVRALATGNNVDITFNNPCHSLIIGSTGSGKTTTFINPMIQILGACGAGSSMVITDPKGELFALHSEFLHSRGYDVKVIDLRDTYSSYRWNPLEPLWDAYQEYANAENNVFRRRDKVEASGLKVVNPIAEYGKEWYEFDNKAYSTLDGAVNAVKIFCNQKYDEMYEDMNDLVSVLVPVANQNDPMWEKGARSITMAVLLAMLEDSEIPELGMTKEKFNLFNMSKILQNSDNDYLELRRYFGGRDILSKAVAASHQVLDAADKTRSSYMSVLLEKLAIFNDTGICALTSSSDFNTADLANRPTALFVKIPDEKDTRHGLASIFLTNIYKSLIKLASTYDDLSLPRNVYYILDEFGNMPKIEKFDKMITVGRSRKIWFNMVVQSYAQLNNVYGDTVADIVKGNCGIKMFIGSNDMGTCKEFSELCGNITVVTYSNSSGGKGNQSTTQNMQTRPLIYPSELQKLNNYSSGGNSIVVTFGNYPLKTRFTPSYRVPQYRVGRMNTDELTSRFFDETEVFYDIVNRNNIMLSPKKQPEKKRGRPKKIPNAS